MEKYFVPCAWKSIFGIDCPICGAQRALAFLLRGDLIASLKMYPPLIPVLLFILIAVVRIVKPSWIGLKPTLQYGSFVLVLVTVNYAVKLYLGL